MPGIFDVLSLSPTEKLFSEFIPGLLSQGLSANSILKQFSTEFGGIRRTKGLSLIRYYNDVGRSNAYVGLLKPDELLNPDLLQPATSALERNFLVRVKARTYDPLLGGYTTNYVSIFTDSYTTQDDFLARFGDLATAYLLGTSPTYEDESLSVQSMVVDQVLRNPAT